MSAEINSRYELLYSRLKGTIPQTIEREGLKPDVAEDILHTVSLLPHPRVASIQDIREVCRLCVSGKLEYLYKYFGGDAQSLLNEIDRTYPEETFGRTLGPPPAFVPEPRQIANYFSWSSAALYETLSLTRSIRSITDIVMKGQCPYCQRDLVTVIVKDELRLRCKSRTTNQCQTVDWQVGQVGQKPQP